MTSQDLVPDDCTSEGETIVVREDEYCPICECSNGHSLSCATFRFNHIEGTTQQRTNIIVAEGKVLRDKQQTLALPGGHTE